MTQGVVANPGAQWEEHFFQAKSNDETKQAAEFQILKIPHDRIIKWLTKKDSE